MINPSPVGPRDGRGKQSRLFILKKITLVLSDPKKRKWLRELFKETRTKINWLTLVWSGLEKMEVDSQGNFH